MMMDTNQAGRLIRRISSARVVESISGRGSVAIGTYSWLPGGGAAFLGLLLPRPVCVPDAGAEPERRSRRPVSEDRLTGCPDTTHADGNAAPNRRCSGFDARA